jgi:hypothetical protein
MLSSEGEQDVNLEKLKHDGIAVVSYDNDKDLFPVLFTIHDSLGQPLRRRRILICDATTSKEEINAFAKRVFSRDFPTHGVYSVINFANMPPVSRNNLVTALLNAAGKRNENSKAIVMILTRKYLDELNLPIARFERRAIISLQSHCFRDHRSSRLWKKQNLFGVKLITYLKNESALSRSVIR